jgi:hypothetical protein
VSGELGIVMNIKQFIPNESLKCAINQYNMQFISKHVYYTLIHRFMSYVYVLIAPTGQGFTNDLRFLKIDFHINIILCIFIVYTYCVYLSLWFKNVVWMNY